MTNCIHCHQPQSAAPVICPKCYEALTVKTVSADDKKLIEELRRRGLGSGTSLGYHSGICDAAADRIEALTDKLAESERQRAAAVAELEALMEKTQSAEACYICANDHDHEVCGSNFTRCVPKWRGPQEAGEGGG